jgi:hypothetical protein
MVASHNGLDDVWFRQRLMTLRLHRMVRNLSAYLTLLATHAQGACNE